MRWLNYTQIFTTIVIIIWRFRLKSLKGYCDELCKELDPKNNESYEYESTKNNSLYKYALLQNDEQDVHSK